MLDTHVLVWAASSDEEGGRLVHAKLSALLSDSNNELFFSAAAIWEIAVKAALRRPGFGYDAGSLRGEFLANGYRELAIIGSHGAAAGALPAIHKDPFDRIMVAQAIVEGMNFVTRDRQVLRYPASLIAV